MAIQLSITARNSRLDSFETTVGVSSVLKIRAGAQPGACSAADSGSTLAIINLPSDWMSAAASGSKSKSGTWSTTSAAGNGTAAHFRVYNSAATVCHMQGSITVTGGGGDMTVDNTSIAVGQTVTVTTFSLTDGNA